ncbi:uncharacterized protein LOC115622384 [Scaptodrosophila lebanonensis]|uniref:Uncharacterized protein LOC115622384 n=1 Tax=Drosophila lebanonensis TaxID=7225 RepID=A0A6J2TAN8_DROLE|nr:uncharacterized protein LOC115622384 [Scaptodrosophila lebanonensis]
MIEKCKVQEPHTEPEQRWLSQWKKNQPQFNALAASALIFISGGMSIAWGAGFAAHSSHRQRLTLHMQICWYGAAILGSIIGAQLSYRVAQRPVYILGSCLVLSCGLLFVLFPDHSIAIIVGRYMDGLANGLVFVPTLCSVGEISVYSMRGMHSAWLDQLSCNLGMLLQLLYTALWCTEWNASIVADQVHGVLSLMCGITALGLTMILCVESPIYLLLRHNERTAVQAIRYLQSPYLVTSETCLQLDEHKHYVTSNRKLSRSRSLLIGLPALIKLSIFRILNALTLTLVIWSALHETGRGLAEYIHTWPYVLFGSLRFLGSLCGAVLMDSTGRKKPTLVGALTSGGLALSYAMICHCEQFTSSALAMLICFQFFAGLTLTASSVYLTEAFPLSAKSHFVAITYILELGTRMMFTLPSSYAGTVMYFYGMGGIFLVFFLLAILSLPETKMITLMEAQEKFRKLFHFKL